VTLQSGSHKEQTGSFWTISKSSAFFSVRYISTTVEGFVVAACAYLITSDESEFVSRGTLAASWFAESTSLAASVWGSQNPGRSEKNNVRKISIGLDNDRMWVEIVRSVVHRCCTASRSQIREEWPCQGTMLCIEKTLKQSDSSVDRWKIGEPVPRFTVIVCVKNTWTWNLVLLFWIESAASHGSSRVGSPALWHEADCDDVGSHGKLNATNEIKCSDTIHARLAKCQDYGRIWGNCHYLT